MTDTKPATIFTDLPALVEAVSERGGSLGMVSLHADPMHLGHLRYIREAKGLCDRLLAVVNGRDATVAKKGYEFLPEIDRAELLSECRSVDYVLVWQGCRMDEVIRAVRPDRLCQGGDRSDLSEVDAGEVRLCATLGIRLTTGVGGAEKVRSSSELVRAAAAASGWTPLQ